MPRLTAYTPVDVPAKHIRDGRITDVLPSVGQHSRDVYRVAYRDAQGNPLRYWATADEIVPRS